MSAERTCSWSIGHPERERLQLTLRSQAADPALEGLGWISARAHIQVGGFEGRSPLYVTLNDLQAFLSEAERLYAELSGTATFRTTEEQLGFTIEADALGRLSARGFLMDRAGDGNKLSFQLSFDQSVLKHSLRELRQVLKRFVA